MAITGASRGLGRALALALAREGASLALCARGEADLEAAADAARRYGGTVVALSADVGSPPDIERFAATALAQLGRVDVLINNASDLGPTPLPFLSDAPSEGLQRVLDVNVIGAFRMTQALIGGMLMRGSGLVLNITSDAAVEGYPGWGLYGASKAALEALTRSWNAELEGSGVRLIAIDPGDMNTAMHRAADPEADPASLRNPDDVAAAMVELLVGGFSGAGRVGVSL